ncbi:hypothetical protein [Massilia sp. DD77]|uniref:hypothetical protein n=1 Tax=Massilia sp. DD77 TaxID=3109349 RepID=UPI002FFD630D
MRTAAFQFGHRGPVAALRGVGLGNRHRVRDVAAHLVEKCPVGGVERAARIDAGEQHAVRQVLAAEPERNGQHLARRFRPGAAMSQHAEGRPGVQHLYPAGRDRSLRRSSERVRERAARRSGARRVPGAEQAFQVAAGLAAQQGAEGQVARVARERLAHPHHQVVAAPPPRHRRGQVGHGALAALGQDALGGFHEHDEHAADLVLGTDDRAIGKGEIGLDQLSVRIQHQFQVVVAHRLSAAVDRLEHRPEGGPGVRPDIARTLAHGPGMLVAENAARRFVVEVDEFRTPDQREGELRAEASDGGRAQFRRPGIRRPERGSAPILVAGGAGKLGKTGQDLRPRGGLMAGHGGSTLLRRRQAECCQSST